MGEETLVSLLAATGLEETTLGSFFAPVGFGLLVDPFPTSALPTFPLSLSLTLTLGLQLVLKRTSTTINFGTLASVEEVETMTLGATFRRGALSARGGGERLGGLSASEHRPT